MSADQPPRVDEIWISATTSHHWRVRVVKVSANVVTFEQIGGPARRRGSVQGMRLSAFLRCYRRERCAHT